MIFVSMRKNEEYYPDEDESALYAAAYASGLGDIDDMYYHNIDNVTDARLDMDFNQRANEFNAQRNHVAKPTKMNTIQTLNLVAVNAAANLHMLILMLVMLMLLRLQALLSVSSNHVLMVLLVTLILLHQRRLHAQNLHWREVVGSFQRPQFRNHALLLLLILIPPRLRFFAVDRPWSK